MFNPFREQPRAFQMIFLLEIWERFGFYTVQGILTLYFIRFLGYNDTEAYYTFGAFSALIYGLTALGGYLGDKVLGTKRTIVLGMIVLALGYLALVFTNNRGVFWALALVCVGGGIFKANPSSLLSTCYEKNDSRLYSAFTLYYMAINLGSLVALLVGPTVASNYGYSYAYFLSFIGLTLGLANYFFQRRLVAKINNEADIKKVSPQTWFVVVVGMMVLITAARYLLHHVMVTNALVWFVTVIALLVYFGYFRGETKVSRIRMGIALVLMLEAICFFVLYQQMPTSLNLFAVNNVRPMLLGVHFDPQIFQALNPVWIIVLSPLLAKFYSVLQQKNKTFSVPYKFASGMILCGISFLFLFYARFYHDEAGMVSAWWLVMSYFFQSTGELLVSALGVAMVAELVPSSIMGFVMGMWFLTVAISGFVGAKVASYTAMPQALGAGVKSLNIYTGVFARIGLVTLGIGVLMWLLAKPLSAYLKD